MSKQVKKQVYIGAWIVLGILLSTIIHAGLEIFYINLLVSNFKKYSFGLSWDQLVLTHHILSVALLLMGIVFGFLSGKLFWRKIYKQV